MLLTFVVTTLVMIMIPGPDAALIMRSSLAHGRVAGLLTMLGGLLGLSVHAAAAAIGLSALLVASPAAFTAVRALGICYLLWLGVHALLSGPAKADRLPEAAPGGSAFGHVRRGLLSNLLNPKVLLLFVTWLPQFLPAHGAVRALVQPLQPDRGPGGHTAAHPARPRQDRARHRRAAGRLRATAGRPVA
jgi:threonine/homoserine/homoserine lactone efflux protein